MQDDNFDGPGASGRRWEARYRNARERRGSAEPSRFERAIAKGAAGEELLGRELNALAEEMDMSVLHDLALPGQRANIDHLVIGPAGVFVVDAKTWDGRVAVGRKTIFHGRQNRRKALTGAREQADRVRAALAVCDHSDIPVQALLCMVNANRGLPETRLDWVGDVGIGTIPNVRRHVSAPGDLPLPIIRELHGLLATRFVISGGGHLPSMAPPAPPEAPPFDHLLQKLLDEKPRGARGARRKRRLLVAGVVVAALVAIGSVLPDPTPPAQPKPMTRAQLHDLRPSLRSAAERAAHGRVRGPALTVKANEFVLRYRRGRCTVRIVVGRRSGSTALHRRRCR